MAFRLTLAKSFVKHFRQLTQQEQRLVRKKMGILAENPYHPSLRTKYIQGQDNLFECSVNMDIRIIWMYDGEEIILALDVGHHDILKQF